MSRRHTYANHSSLGDIGKDIRRGVEITLLGVYVEQKNLGISRVYFKIVLQGSRMLLYRNLP